MEFLKVLTGRLATAEEGNGAKRRVWYSVGTAPADGFRKPLIENKKVVAVRVGFEPTVPVRVQRFSRPPDSTTLAPHRTPM